MKNMLLYFYNLTIDNLDDLQNDNYSFYIDYDKYYLTKVTRPTEDIDEIVKIIKDYPHQFHTLYYNRFNSLYSEYLGNKYILMKLNSPEHIELNMADIIQGELPYQDKKTTLSRTDWSTLWAEKIDYLEYQVSELGSNHPLITKTFSYYAGLVENAIEYFNMLDPNNAPTSLTHRRIKSPTYTFDFYNPLDLVVDFRIRNISSYIKINFFNGINILPEVDTLINKNILSPLEYNLLFCRLLYPGYYFDAIHKIFEENENEEILLKYIDKANDYENLLSTIFQKFSSKASMIKIDWLIKKS